MIRAQIQPQWKKLQYTFSKEVSELYTEAERGMSLNSFFIRRGTPNDNFGQQVKISEKEKAHLNFTFM